MGAWAGRRPPVWGCAGRGAAQGGAKVLPEPYRAYWGQDTFFWLGGVWGLRLRVFAVSGLETVVFCGWWYVGVMHTPDFRFVALARAALGVCAYAMENSGGVGGGVVSVGGV